MDLKAMEIAFSKHHKKDTSKGSIMPHQRVPYLKSRHK